MNSILGQWTRVRVGLVALFFVVVAILLGHRAYSLQVQGAQRLRDLAEDNYRREIEIAPSRGRILDRHGKEFASTVEVNSVFGNPRVLAHVPGAADRLARVLSVDRDLLRRRLSSPKYFAWLKRRITPDEEAAVRALDFPGIHFRPEPRRFYPLRSVGATVIGFAGASGKGLAGLERVFDSTLVGDSATVQGLRDALGREILIDGLDDTSAASGADLQLTLDSYLTMEVQKALQKAVRKHDAKAATGVIMDPRTGHVLAMASVPSFNPNHPGTALQQGARNRAITDAFEPGSTMKTFTFAAALNRGKLRPSDVFDCENGRMKVGRHTIRDTHPLGRATAAEVYRQSSNIGTVKIARRLERQDLYDTLVDFGFGRRTGVAVSGERDGIIWPVRKWSEIGFANMAFGQGLTATPLQITAGFAAVAAGGIYRPPRLAWKLIRPDGRQELLPYVPPKQASHHHQQPEAQSEADPHAEAEAPGAGGGGAHGSDAQRLSGHSAGARRVMAPEAARTLLDIMAGVPSADGTARKAALAGYKIAGKTGTAQKVANGRYDKTKWFSSFVGILPANDPEVVIGVFVDEPWPEHLGGLVAAPAFAEIAESVVKYLNIPPSEPVAADERSAALEAPSAITEGPGSDVYILALSDEEFFPIDEEVSDGAERSEPTLIEVPNVVGLTLGQALATARTAGLRLVPQGSGVARRQEPGAGQQVSAGANLRVMFEASR